MNNKSLLSLGWIVAITYMLGSLLFGCQLEGYSAISQTVSEIGKEGSPLFGPWKMFMISVGFLLVLFSIGIILYARENYLSIAPAIFILLYGMAELLVGVFPSPHPLHNVFWTFNEIGIFGSFDICVGLEESTWIDF